MFRGYGYNIVTLDGKTIEEHDTFQCAHCNMTVFIEPKEPSPWCMNCDRQWCGQAKCRECAPFMRKIEREEATALAKRRLWLACDSA